MADLKRAHLPLGFQSLRFPAAAFCCCYSLMILCHFNNQAQLSTSQLEPKSGGG